MNQKIIVETLCALLCDGTSLSKEYKNAFQLLDIQETSISLQELSIANLSIPQKDTLYLRGLLLSCRLQSSIIEERCKTLTSFSETPNFY